MPLDVPRLAPLRPRIASHPGRATYNCYDGPAERIVAAAGFFASLSLAIPVLQLMMASELQSLEDVCGRSRMQSTSDFSDQRPRPRQGDHRVIPQARTIGGVDDSSARRTNDRRGARVANAVLPRLPRSAE